jgi:segregation and condensation protein B
VWARHAWGRLNPYPLYAILRDWFRGLARYLSGGSVTAGDNAHPIVSLSLPEAQETAPSSYQQSSRTTDMSEITPPESDLLNSEQAIDSSRTAIQTEDDGHPETFDPEHVDAGDRDLEDGDLEEGGVGDIEFEHDSSDDAASEDDEGATDGLEEGPALDAPELIPLISLLESLLFVAEEPVEPARLAQALDRTIGEVDAGLIILQDRYEQENRGIRLQRRSGRVQLVTNPTASAVVETFLNLDLSTRLSGPALEALAVIAYQQPVTRSQIEAVRGVDCSGVLRKLQQQGLIEEAGRLEAVGRPILYGVTDLFMQHFGLTSLTELPQLPEIDADALSAVLDLIEEENGG